MGPTRCDSPARRRIWPSPLTKFPSTSAHSSASSSDNTTHRCWVPDLTAHSADLAHLSVTAPCAVTLIQPPLRAPIHHSKASTRRHAFATSLLSHLALPPLPCCAMLRRPCDPATPDTTASSPCRVGSLIHEDHH
jgi:hypothetical protein